MELTSSTGNPEAPCLSVADGVVIIGLDDRDEPLRLRAGGDGVAVIGRYTTRIRNPRGADRRRLGWQLLDDKGRVVAWLGNSEREMYDAQDVAAFADAAGLRCEDLGDVSWSELQRIPRSARIGAVGTSIVGSYVAPALQWVLCMVVIGGVMLVEGPTIRDDFGDDAGGLQVTFALVRIFVGIFGGIVVAKMLGRALMCHREQRQWRQRGPTAVLRPSVRPAAMSITQEPDGVVVRDAFRRQLVASHDGIALQRYVVGHGARDGGLSAQGLLVRNPRKVALDVPGEFDSHEVATFAARIHARVMETETDPRQLPNGPNGGYARVTLSGAWWARGGGVVEVLLYASPIMAVVAILWALGVVPIPEWSAWVLGAISLLVPGGRLLVRLQAPVWMVDSDSVPEPS